MNETELTNALANAIHDDNDLVSFCQVNYGRRHKVYIGIDYRDPPDPETDYPAINIEFDGKREGFGQDDREHDVVISGGLYEAGLKTLARDNIVEYEFTRHMADFVNYVKAAVIGTDVGQLEISELEILYDNITFFPALKFEMHILFREAYYQGSTVFET